MKLKTTNFFQFNKNSVCVEDEVKPKLNEKYYTQTFIINYNSGKCDKIKLRAKAFDFDIRYSGNFMILYKCYTNMNKVINLADVDTYYLIEPKEIIEEEYNNTN